MTAQADGGPGAGVFVAADVHYLAAGGARAAAVVAADAAFSYLLADRTAEVAQVPPCQPGQFYRRELPPLHAVLAGLDGIRLLIVDGYAGLGPGGRPGLGAHAHAESRQDAADLIRGMAGPYRLPDALRRADAIARDRGVSR